MVSTFIKSLLTFNFKQGIFDQELRESRQSFTNLVSNIENLPENFRQILHPIENVSNELLSGQVNLAGNIQDQKEC